MSGDGARRLASVVLGLLGGRDGRPLVARVTAIAGSTATAPVTVRVNGADLQLPRLASYPTPAIGDTVQIIRTGGTWVVQGRLTGYPT